MVGSKEGGCFADENQSRLKVCMLEMRMTCSGQDDQTSDPIGGGLPTISWFYFLGLPMLAENVKHYRFTPPLRFGSFLIVLAPPCAVCGGAAPIVKRPPPPPEVEGASKAGAPKGDGGCGDDCPKPPVFPNPEGGNDRFPPAAGEAGCEDPKVKAPVEAAVCAPNENGVD